MSSRLKVTVNGKINLSLNILGADGGYHLLDMVLASVNIADAIILSVRNDSKVNITYNTDAILNNIMVGDTTDKSIRSNNGKSSQNPKGTAIEGSDKCSQYLKGTAIEGSDECSQNLKGTADRVSPQYCNGTVGGELSSRDVSGVDNVLDNVGVDGTAIEGSDECSQNLKVNTGTGNQFCTASRADSVTMAVNALRQYVGDFGVDIIVDKRLPLGGGMGGSSADAAGVIEGLDYLLKLNLSPREKAVIGLKVGSDVPYMLNGGFARVAGRGEKVNCFDCKAILTGLIILDSTSVSAASSYGKFDQLNFNKKSIKSDNDKIIQLLQNGDLTAIKNFDNALTEASISLNPNIAVNLDLATKSGAIKSFMTGSGSSVVALYANADDVDRAAANLSKTCTVCKFNTVNKGIIFH